MIKKRILSAATAVSILISGTTIQARDISGYKDVKENEWYYQYVKDVSEKQLMTGLNEMTFAPAENLARAQFATILYRMAGEPAITYENKYSDVADGQFYSVPVTWASQTGIITGYSNTDKFGPADSLTREQMATMMYRYAKVSGMDTSEGENVRQNLAPFPDRGRTYPFAYNSMSWVVGKKIITGDRGNLNPQGLVNRAVCAAMLSRLTEAENIPVWIEPEYEDIWVVDKEAWTEEKEIAESFTHDICTECKLDLTQSWLDEDGELDWKEYGKLHALTEDKAKEGELDKEKTNEKEAQQIKSEYQKYLDAHIQMHLDKGESGEWHISDDMFSHVTGYETIKHPEEGHWEKQLAKQGHWGIEGWHEPMYEALWIVDKEAWTEEKEIIEYTVHDVCTDCGIDLYQAFEDVGGSWFNEDGILDSKDYTAFRVAHAKAHLLSGGCGGWHSSAHTYPFVTGYEMVRHPEEGHWEKRLVKEGYWDTPGPHKPVYEDVWVVDQKAWKETKEITGNMPHDLCWCGKDLTQGFLDAGGTFVGYWGKAHKEYSDYKKAHYDTCERTGKLEQSKTSYTVVIGYEEIFHPEEGHWEKRLFKEEECE